MARDPIPTGYTTLPEALARLAAKTFLDRDIGSLRQLRERCGIPLDDIVNLSRGDEAEALQRALLSDSVDAGPYSQPPKEDLNNWAKRDFAIVKLRKALQEGALIGFVRDPVSGTMFRILGADWWQASCWRQTITGGRIMASEFDRIACHAGRDVLIEKAAFDKWLGHQTDRERRAAEKNCLDWLIGEMRASPERTDRPKTPDWLCEAKERFGVSERAFDRAWASAILTTDSKWGVPGPKSAR